MATLREKGAGYVQRENIKEQYLKDALDDVASQVQAIRRQGNFSSTGSPVAPSSPVSLDVQSANGLVTVSINHPKAVPGTQWVLTYSTSPTFVNPIEVVLLKPTWQQFLPQQTLFFKATAKLAASSESQPVYLGTATTPQPISTGNIPSSS